MHEGYVFTILESGAQRFRHRGSDHLAAVGSMVLINPDELHTGSKAHEEGWRYRGFYPDLHRVTDVLDELEIATGGLPTFADSVLHDPEVTRRFLDLHCLLERNASALGAAGGLARGDPAAVQPPRAHRCATAGGAGAPGRGAGPRDDGGAPGLAAILEELAALVGLSPFHFARVFQRATGMPPHAWLKQRRLEQARAMLRSGCAPLSVAMQLGFADQSHLTRQFKQTYGVGPGEYRTASARSFKTD